MNKRNSVKKMGIALMALVFVAAAAGAVWYILAGEKSSSAQIVDTQTVDTQTNGVGKAAPKPREVPESEALITNAMDTFKTGDLAAFSNFFFQSDIESRFPSDVMALALGTDEKTADAFVKAWCAAADYKVISSIESGDTAQVVLQVSGAEMMKLLEFVHTQVANSEEYAALSPQERTKVVFEKILSSTQGVPRSTPRPVRLSLAKVGGEWKIDDDTDLLRAFFPGYLS